MEKNDFVKFKINTKVPIRGKNKVNIENLKQKIKETRALGDIKEMAKTVKMIVGNKKKEGSIAQKYENKTMDESRLQMAEELATYVTGMGVEIIDPKPLERPLGNVTIGNVYY